MAALLIISFFVIILIGAPIAVALGGSTLITLVQSNMSITMMPFNVYSSIAKFLLLAIPFFVLAGNIMDQVGISEKLISLARVLVGHIRGGMAIVCVGVSCFFAAISGSGPATVAALGMIVIPAMVNVGYERGTASALMATAGSIGLIIPPSISYVLYSSITGVSTGKLFIAGFIPGLLMGIALVIATMLVTKRQNLAVLPKSSRREVWVAFKDAIWGLMMPVIILGGIYGGIFTATEAAAVSAVYGLLVGVFVYKTLTIKTFYQILVKSVQQTGAILLTVAMASLFSYVVTIAGISTKAINFLTAVSGGNTVIFLIIANIILLIAGCFIDGNSGFYIFTPLLYPVARALGYDTIAFGIVMTMNLAIGLVTPPVGLNLYVASGVSNTPLKETVRHVLPFVIASAIVLLLVTYIPSLSTWLPSFMK